MPERPVRRQARARLAAVKLDPKVLAALRELGRIGGKKGGRIGGLKGGKARMAKLTPAQRSKLAKKAAVARWKKTRAK